MFGTKTGSSITRGGIGTVDPNFAPFDPADLDPPLTPAERIKRGFEAERVIDRSRPGYPGAFLNAGDVFDPAQRKFLGVPMDASTTPSTWTRGPSYSPELARKLGSRDLDQMEGDRIAAFIKKTLGH